MGRQEEPVGRRRPAEKAPSVAGAVKFFDLNDDERAFVERWWTEREQGLFKGEAQEEIGAISRELANQTDRGAAIIGGAIIEDHLRDALSALLVPGFKPSRFPVRSFDARITTAEALGVIGAVTAADLRWIKDIRNDFAHASKPIDFATPGILEKCRKLQLARFAFFSRSEYAGEYMGGPPELRVRDGRRLYLDVVTIVLECLIIQTRMMTRTSHVAPLLP